MARSPSKGERALKFALDHAARHGVIIVAAAGNQGTVGGTIITSHPWVIAVAACDANRQTRQLVQSGRFHWPARSARARRGRDQPGGGRPNADAWRNERRRAFRDRRRRPGVVPTSRRDGSPNSPGVPSSARPRARFRDAPFVGCVGGVSICGNEVNHDGMKKSPETLQKTNLFEFACRDLFATRRLVWAMSSSASLTRAGIRSCGGCEKRAAALNRRVVFTR